MARPSALLTAILLTAALLAGWRQSLALGAQTTAAVCLAALALLSLWGGYVTARAVRRTLFLAAIEEGSPLRALLAGRIGALVTSLAATLATATALSYASLTATASERMLLLAGLLFTGLLLLLSDRLLTGHVRPALRLAVAGPVAVALAGGLFGLLHMWVAYDTTPFPAWLDPGSLSATLSGALTALPRAPGPLHEVFTGLRAVEALSWWLVAQPGGTTLPVILVFLLQGAAIFFSLAKIAVDAAAALIWLTERRRP